MIVSAELYSLKNNLISLKESSCRFFRMKMKVLLYIFLLPFLLHMKACSVLNGKGKLLQQLLIRFVIRKVNAIETAERERERNDEYC